MPADRRLAAILAADVVGSSRLIEADEAYGLSAICEVLTNVLVAMAVRHGGRLVKTMGDGALIEFASPVAAVTCAIEVQEAVMARAAAEPETRRVLLRIGINLGDVVAMPDGDLYGDGVNVAARLETIAEPGGIAISGSVYDHIGGRVSVSFTDRGEMALKNIARPVRVWALTGSAGTASREVTWPRLALPDKPSLAVLPFTNMSGDPEQEYFADGLVADIITALSRVKSFFVIARNSSFTYKGCAVDTRQVARDLGVRYVLEGSVRKAGQRVRITGQLIEAETGRHVWAERFDGDLTDLFELQDKMTRDLVGAIEPSVRLTEIDRLRSRPTEDLGAYELFLKGLSALSTYTPDSLRTADTLMRAAIARDQNFADAWGALATISMFQTVGGLVSFQQGAISGAAAARNAAASDPDNPMATASAAAAFAFFSLDFDQATDLADRAMQLAPTSAQVLMLSGFAYNFCADSGRALALLLEARRLSPRDPRGFVTGNQIAMAHFFQRRFDQAIDWAERNLRQHPDFPPSWQFLAASLAHVGRLDEASEAVKTIRRLRPEFSVSPGRVRPWRYPWMTDLFVNGIRLAGLVD